MLYTLLGFMHVQIALFVFAKWTLNTEMQIPGFIVGLEFKLQYTSILQHHVCYSHTSHTPAQTMLVSQKSGKGL